MNWPNNDAEDAVGRPRLRRPANVGKLGIEYRSADERQAVLANWRAASDALDVGNVVLSGYDVLDLSLSFAASDLLQLYARVQNATDEEYFEVDRYNTAAQAVYGGVRLRF